MSGTGRPEEVVLGPEPHESAADWRPGATRVQPGPEGLTDTDQPGGIGKMTHCFLDIAFLIEVRPHDPLMQRERTPRRLEYLPAIDNAQRVINLLAQPLQDGGQVPGIDAVAVDRRLAPYRFEPGTIEKRRPKRVIVERLIEPRDGVRCAFERTQQRSTGC